ncbi:Hypothetical protein D9617_24g017230 [Elsinoe fawcettii]|nr:Hypothetical protein D9617_24g017230 [Elsinoe fawcettii]
MAVPEERHWLTQAVLLTVLSPTDGDQTVLEMRARWAPGHGREVRNFEVLETGERLLAKEWEHPGGMAMVLAVHTSCLTICKRAMNFIHGFNVASRRQAPSMFELHQILTSRVMQSDILGHLIDEPSDYYGARRFQAQQWELYTNLGHDENTVESCSSDNDPDLEDLIYYHLEHDPIRVPSLTTYVLDQLQAIPDSAAMGSRHRYLPAEIVTEIVCVLRRFDDIPAARDRLLSQEFWQQALSDGLYPWLWDFSASDVAAKQTMCPVGMRTWLKSSTLLTVPLGNKAPTAASTVIRLSADWDPHTYDARGFTVHEPGETVLTNAYWEDDHIQDGQLKFTFVVAVHEACLAIASRLMMGHNGKSATRMAHLGHFWDAIKPLVEEASIHGTPSLICFPNRHYGATNFRMMQWELFSDLDDDETEGDETDFDDYDRAGSKFFYLESDPLDIPAMTSQILGGLCPVPGETARAMSPMWQYRNDADHANQTSILHCILNLPQEIQQIIVNQLRPFDNPPRQCTYMFPPTMWKQALLNGILPWLWDLDHKMIHAQSERDQMWDWEKLVRRLAQDDVFLPGSPDPNIPRGMKNRRRIWQIIDDMRIEQPFSTKPYTIKRI